MAVFFARIVIPRSRSSSLESITRSTWASLARKVPLWFSMASTSVVLPWSTCAMMAMLRMLVLKTTFLPVGGKPHAIRQTEGLGRSFSLQYAAKTGVATLRLRLLYLLHDLRGWNAHSHSDRVCDLTLGLFRRRLGAKQQHPPRILFVRLNLDRRLC